MDKGINDGKGDISGGRKNYFYSNGRELSRTCYILLDNSILDLRDIFFFAIYLCFNLTKNPINKYMLTFSFIRLDLIQLTFVKGRNLDLPQ